MTEKLKPCPFCGESLLKITMAMGEAWVHCSGCKAASGTGRTRPEAAAAWNRRELDSKKADDGATIETCRHCGLEWRCPDCDGGLGAPVRLPEGP